MEMAVLIQAISVLSDATIVRCKARLVRSSARTVPRSFGAVLTRTSVSVRLMGHPSHRSFYWSYRGVCRLNWGSLPGSGQTRHRSAQNQVGRDRKDNGNDGRLPHIYKAQLDDLINDVERQSKNEYPSDTLPPVLQHVDTLPVIPEKGPEIGRLASPGICQP